MKPGRSIGLNSRRMMLFAAVCFSLSLFCSGTAGEQMIYIYNAPESENDVRYVYHWEILRTALERTAGKYGPYRMFRSEQMNEIRQERELSSGSGKLTVMYCDDKPGFGARLCAVYIPVDRNLVGYRIFLIRKERQKEFSAVRNAADLRRYVFGFGAGWIDVDIMKRSGFSVLTGTSYEGLFNMLARKRFDVFSRSAAEIVDEYEARREQYPDLHIEDTLCLSIPQPMYFWFSKTAEGRRLAARAEEGMRMMLDDGTYDRIFERHYGHDIRKLRLSSRRIIRLDNPFLGPKTPYGDKRLWFDPSAY